MLHQKMSSVEKRATLSLASIFAFRMLGLFMVLPIFVFYANQLEGATPLLIGVATGIYGLTQALLQIPFGMFSDRIGRKPVIFLGLSIFAVGSIVAAMAHSMDGIILGRALQGAGAVGSTLMALMTDLTREEHRTKAMALLGAIIGISFTLSLVLGPLLNTSLGVKGLFWLTALLAVVGMLMLHWVVPNPSSKTFSQDALPQPKKFKTMLLNPELLRLDFGVLALHAILTASFAIALPVTLKNLTLLPVAKQWQIYLPVLSLAFISMVPLMIFSEKKGKTKNIFLMAIFVLALAEIGFILCSTSLLGMGLCLYLFFTAFTLLEANLPALISKVAPPGGKGTAMGVYSSSQFLGIFLGGVMGGWLYGNYHLQGVCIATASLALLWLCLAVGMKKPRTLGTLSLKVAITTEEDAQQLAQRLLQVAGVVDATVTVTDQTAYLKVDHRVINKEELNSFSIN